MVENFSDLAWDVGKVLQPVNQVKILLSVQNKSFQ